MSNAKLLGLINLKTLPSDLSKLLDESINILKGAEDKDFEAFEKAGIKKIKDLVKLEDLGIIKGLDSLIIEKLVTSAKIIQNLALQKKSTGRKVVVAGLDAAGKTTIIKTILDPFKYRPGDEKPTHGVDNKQYDLFGFNVNLWDLGGQSLYRNEYLSEKQSTRHFGFTNLFVFVIDVQAQKRFQEAFDYLKRIIEIYKHLEEAPFCLILIHKSDPDYNKKDIEKNTNTIIGEAKKLLVGFPVAFHNTSMFDKGSIFRGFSKGIREISMVKEVLTGILSAFRGNLSANYIGLYNKTGICIAETETIDEFLKTFTINVILSEELNIFPDEASKLILALKKSGFCIVERLELGKERFYLAWRSENNPENVTCTPLIEDMQPWIINFLE